MKNKTNKRTWKLLSQALILSERTIQKYRRLPGAPDRPDLYEWVEFVQANHLGFAKNKLPTAKERQRATDAIAQFEAIDNAVFVELEEIAADNGLTVPAVLGLMRFQNAPKLDREGWQKWMEGKDAAALKTEGERLAQIDD